MLHCSSVGMRRVSQVSKTCGPVASVQLDAAASPPQPAVRIQVCQLWAAGFLANAGPVFTEKVFPCRPCDMSCWYCVPPPKHQNTKKTPKWFTVNWKYLRCNQLAYICSPVPLKNTQHVKTTMSKMHRGIGIDTRISWMQESQIKTIIDPNVAEQLNFLLVADCTPT